MSFWQKLFGRQEPHRSAHAGSEHLDSQRSAEPDGPEPESTTIDEVQAVELEITDVLDLHSFPPSEVKEVVLGYLDAAYEDGLRSLRIIHGRGTGTQRKMLHKLLDRDPRVIGYGDAPAEAGGWGATVVELD